MTRLGHLGPDTEAGAAEVFSEMVAKCDNFVSVASQDQVCMLCTSLTSASTESEQQWLYPQVRFSPNSLSDLCHILTAELVKRGSHTAIRGISIMVRAVRKLQVRLHTGEC